MFIISSSRIVTSSKLDLGDIIVYILQWYKQSSSYDLLCSITLHEYCMYTVCFALYEYTVCMQIRIHLNIQ